MVTSKHHWLPVNLKGTKKYRIHAYFFIDQNIMKMLIVPLIIGHCCTQKSILNVKIKKATVSFFICIVIQGSLTDQRYVDEVLHPHVLQIYQTDRNISLFQQDNTSIPAIWHGHVCKLAMSYPLDWPFRSQSISDWPPLGSSKLADTWLYRNTFVTFP